MKKFLWIILVLIHTQVLANMANPVFEGTLGGRPFVNQYVDVVHEDLFIKIDKDFEKAEFNVKYHINSSKDGFQIPFLFYASDYLDSFSVFVDGVEVKINEVPFKYKVPENTKFKDFSYFFEKSEHRDYSTTTISESSKRELYITLEDMIYFQTDISKGTHIIEVNYRAEKWIDTWGWIKEYSFRYALSPAKYWKSFGTLDIIIDSSDFDESIEVNLGQPKRGKLNSIAEWSFNEMPTELIQITFNPKVSKTAQSLMDIGPRGLAYITGFFLFILHLWITFIYRKRYPLKGYSLVVIIGSILAPFLFLISWTYCYDLIDLFIGTHVSRRHGYWFFIYFLYPLILPIYGFLFWFIDKQLKKRYK